MFYQKIEQNRRGTSNRNLRKNIENGNILRILSSKLQNRSDKKKVEGTSLELLTNNCERTTRRRGYQNNYAKKETLSSRALACSLPLIHPLMHKKFFI